MKKYIDKYIELPIPMRATVAFFFCTLMQKGIAIITTPIFTRIMSAQEYGKLGAFNSWYDIMLAIFSLSMVGGVYNTAIVKFGNDKKVMASSAQGLLCISSLICAIIYFPFYKFWNALFNLNTFQFYSIIILVLTTSSFGLWAAEQRNTYNYRSLVLLTIIVSLAKPILGIILIEYLDDNVSARILGNVLVEIICYGWIIVFQFKRGKRFFSGKYWKYFFVYSIPLIAHALSQSVLNSSDRIMIQQLIGDNETGYYNLAYNVSMLMIIINSSLSQTLAPWTYQKLKNNRECDINKIAILSCIIIAFMNLVLIMIAPDMISIFAPKGYAEAAYVIPPVAMSVYLMCLYEWFVRVEYYYEKTYYILISSVSGALVNLLLNYLLLPYFGYVAAGYTTLVSYCIYVVLHYYFMRKICKKELGDIRIYNEKQLIVITSLFMVLGFCISLTYKYPLMRYIIIVCTVLALIIFRKTIHKELNNIISITKKGRDK